MPTGLEQDQAYPIVDTGQDQCFSDQQAIACPEAGGIFYGQDAHYVGHQPSFTDNGDGTVTDNVTGLVWQQSPDTNGDGVITAADKFNQADAASYCENLTLAGRSDWRLPDIKTLYSLIDFRGIDPDAQSTDTSGLQPFINTGYFDFAYGDLSAGERIIDIQYASSTLYVSPTPSGRMFGVNFADGRIKGYDLIAPIGEKTFAVMCVRDAVNYGQNDFIENVDGTIWDRATGLMWSQTDSGSDYPNGMNWEQALDWVQWRNASGYLGYSDWRLPNVKELQSLVDYTRSPDTTASAAIDPLFEVTPMVNEAGAQDYPNFWSGTTHLNSSPVPATHAAYVAFGRAMGYMNGHWVDVHGAGAQRSDPKAGDPAAYPTGRGPQGDAVHIYNAVRLVRDAQGS
ncbi:hypothetical protein CCR91_10945 [Thiorhodovibrio winogradskyi]|nr:hypothetical protein [Thiorhodovibrio winogradskyi]